VLASKKGIKNEKDIVEQELIRMLAYFAIGHRLFEL